MADQSLQAASERPATTPAGPPSAIVIGGGLAGMAATIALEAAGVSVTLLEARRTLGGRAASFTDPQSGQDLDNCQHVLLGCCTNLRDFYRRIGADQRIRWQRTIHFRDVGRSCDLWAAPPLPAPLHLGPAMLGFGLLGWAQRLSLTRAMVAMARLGRDGREQLESTPFGQWLDAHAQGPDLLHRFYDPILRGALNEEPRQASAKYAIQVFQDAMLSHSAGCVLGVPGCPLSELYRDIPARDVRLGARVSGLRFDAHRIDGVDLPTGDVLRADAYVLAVGHETALRWMPPALARADGRFAGLRSLQYSPILGAHLWFDRPVMAETHAVLLTGPLQWIFRKDRAGRVLHGVISAAQEWLDVPRPQALDAFQRQLRRLLPAARDARLERGLVVIEKRATFRPLPGVDHHRPPQAPGAGAVANLFLAGDYTRTHWPGTMEGAVRSGYLAAEAVLRTLGRTEQPSPLAPDLPAQWPARFLAARQ